MNATIKASWIAAMRDFTAEQQAEFIIAMVNYQIAEGGTKKAAPSSEDTSVDIALRFAIAELNDSTPMPATDNTNSEEDIVIKPFEPIEESGPSPREIAELYNSICVSYSPINRLTDARCRKIATRARLHSIEEWEQAFRNLEDSDFCKRSGFATFDWVIKSETNFQKLLEGNYNTRRQSESVLEKNQRALRELGITEQTLPDWAR